ERLPQRMLCRESIQFRHHLLVPTEAELSLDLRFLDLHPALTQARLLRVHDLGGRNVLERRAAPQFQRRAERRHGGLRCVIELTPSLLGEPLELMDVEVALAHLRSEEHTSELQSRETL